ncbi:MAG: sugar-binding domain-containing protein, partial [Limisphaerales bacterium]
MWLLKFSPQVFGQNPAVPAIEPGKWSSLVLCAALAASALSAKAADFSSPRERLSFNADWKFIKGDPAGSTTKLDYQTLKPWLLPMGAELSRNTRSPERPQGNPGGDVAYVQAMCDESGWRAVTLPHDWGIEGPFNQAYSGETGKLPWWGVAWYRKHFQLAATDAGKQIFLDVDGAMAYAAVWVNGQFAGGWPYGYSSWELDLTPLLKPGADNVIAIRLDNPPNSS